MKNLIDIVALEDVTTENAFCGGGKFAGLAKIQTLLKEYNAKYHLDFAIPQTYAIALDAYDKYNIAKNGVPEELLNQAMYCLVKLGGNVAVRSSADVEDQENKSFSGEFDSVLSVKNRSQMAEALAKVYDSAQKAAGAKMGIVLQSMVDTPKMAGVAYSQTWYGNEPFIILNYTQNSLAADLLAGKRYTGADLFAVSKPLFMEGQNFTRLDLEKFNDPKYNLVYVDGYRTPQMIASPQDREKYKNQILLAALCSQLEGDLGYPVDMEFAVSKNNQINILQQRPYKLPEFYEIRIDDYTLSNLSPNKTVITGKVGIVDGWRKGTPKEDCDINICRTGKTTFIFTKDSFGVFPDFLTANKSLFNANYNHHGNMSREGLDFTYFEYRGPEKKFDSLKDGDYLYLDLITGDCIIYPQEEYGNLDLFPEYLRKMAQKVNGR